MNTEELKNLTGGCLIRKESPLDYKYSIISGANNNFQDFPMSFRLWTSGIKNQQSKSTCVAHSLATTKETQEYYDTHSKKLFSTNWIYGNRKDTQYQGEGMYIEEALNNLKNDGAVYLDSLADNLNYKDSLNIVKNERDKLLILAQDHKIKSYAIPQNNNEIKSSIYNDKSPVVIGISIYESFYNINNTGIAPVPNIMKEKNYGGHAVVIIGWTVINNEEYWVVQNSWGEDWGDNGVFYIAIDKYFPIYEKWCIVDEIDYHINFDDIKGRWSENAINKCVRAGLINGFEDGTFRPTETLTREQLCSVMTKFLDKI